MLFRHLLLFIFTLGLLSGCGSVPHASDPKPPPQPPLEQEKASSRQESDAVSEPTSETNTEPEDEKKAKKEVDQEAEPEAEKEVDHEAQPSSDKNSPPEVLVEELIPEDNIPQELSPLSEVEPLVEVENQPDVPQASLPDRKSHIPDQVRFLLLSPQLEVHFAEGAAEAEDAPTEQAEALKSAGSERSAAAESAPPAESASPEASDKTDAQSTTDVQIPEKSEKLSETPPTEQKTERKTDPTTEQEEELIRAEPGEQVHLTLPGLGWIYNRGASSAQGVVFQSRSYKDNSTEFVFIAQGLGRYTLSFQQQDSSLGTSSYRTVAVKVADQKAPDQDVAQAANSTQTASVQSDKTDFSFDLLEETISSQNPSDTEDQLKALLRMPQESGVFTLGKAKQKELALLVEAGEFLFEAQRESTAEQALRLYLDLTEERGEHTGRVLYLLGQIYESPLPPRDELQSAEYYRKIVSFYPTDPYRRRAEQRIKYLQRHFLQIR